MLADHLNGNSDQTLIFFCQDGKIELGNQVFLYLNIQDLYDETVVSDSQILVYHKWVAFLEDDHSSVYY